MDSPKSLILLLGSMINFLALKPVHLNVVKHSGLFFAANNRNAIEEFQIRAFNDCWSDAYTNIPFYKQWKITHKLPDKIDSLSELALWPTITKQDLMQNEQLLLRVTPPDTHVVTSGSTGIPLNLPVKKGLDTHYNMWIGRAANGIMPNERTFLIWGHHHLHGSGVKRILNVWIRNIKDYLMSYCRISAYDTSQYAMAKAYDKYLKFNPTFVIGYSTSILSFVRCNSNKSIPKSPKAVLCTAGPLSPKEQDEIREFFKAPLCMEYGSMECGVMAYTIENAKKYNVFWNTHILQGENDGTAIKNIVTTITPKYFPLIRYDIGDYLDIPTDQNISNILTVNSIIGRPTDIITLENGTSFNAMLIEACVEHLPEIISHQLIVHNDSIKILIVGNKLYDEMEIKSVRQKLHDVIPGLKQTKIDIHQVYELNKNSGGKVPLVIRIK